MPLPGRPRCGISAMLGHDWRQSASPAFRLMIATSWLAPDSWKEKQEKEILEASGEGLDWTEYLFLVDRHRIPALSWAAIGRVPAIAVPSYFFFLFTLFAAGCSSGFFAGAADCATRASVEVGG